MIGLDSNVLVRYLARDDEQQFCAAERAILSAVEAGEAIHVCIPVLMETVWLLRSTYGVDRRRIAEILQALLDIRAFALENEPTVEAALDAFQSSSADCSPAPDSRFGNRRRCRRHPKRNAPAL